MAENTREAWLLLAVDALRPMFKPYGKDVPDALMVSIGYAKRPGKGIGWCYKPGLTEDGASTIFLSPELAADDPVRLLGTLLHEMVHAADGGESGHKGWFATTAKALGLTGKMTATTVGDDLRTELETLVVALGDFPHKRLTAGETGGKVGAQKNRQIKIECPDDGYKLRGSRTTLELGIPNCPVCDEPLLMEGV